MFLICFILTQKLQDSCAAAKAGQTPHLETNLFSHSASFHSVEPRLESTPAAYSGSGRESRVLSPVTRVRAQQMLGSSLKLPGPRPSPHTDQLIEAALKNNSNYRFPLSPQKMFPSQLVMAKNPLWPLRSLFVVIFGRLRFLRLRGRSDGRHPQSHQCSVTRQLTYLPYNYLDFFVTPVVAGTGTGGGEGIFINKQLKSAASYILFVDSIPEKWLQTSWLWSYLELTSDGWCETVATSPLSAPALSRPLGSHQMVGVSNNTPGDYSRPASCEHWTSYPPIQDCMGPFRRSTKRGCQ